MTPQIEYFVHWKTGQLMETERNPCRCHPDDYIIKKEWDSRGYLRNGFTISTKNRRDFFRYVKRAGFEALR